MRQTPRAVVKFWQAVHPGLCLQTTLETKGLVEIGLRLISRVMKPGSAFRGFDSYWGDEKNSVKSLPDEF